MPNTVGSNMREHEVQAKARLAATRLTVRQILAISRRILTEYIRQRRSLVFWAVFPALMLLLFGLMYRSNPSLRAGFDTTPAGILIGAALFFSCLGGTVSLIVAERERRTLRRLLVSPLRPAAYFLGIVLALLVIALMQAVIVYLLALMLGARYHGSVWLGILIVVFSVFSYAGLGFVFGARFAKRAEDVNGPVAAFGVPLLVLAGTFFPVSLLPESLLRIAYLDPVFHMNQALKGVAGRGEGWAELSGHLIFLAVFTVIALALGMRSYRRMLSEEKRA
jgi:ABC-2 type transport system permease protein